MCKATPQTKVGGTHLLYTLAQIVDARDEHDDLLVAWLVPGRSEKALFKKGRKTKVVNIFGAWKPLAACTLEELDDTVLPETLVSQSAVLETNVLLQDDKIPFAVLDALRTKHGIDMTGLSVSSTAEGNLYRNHCLMMGASA